MRKSPQVKFPDINFKQALYERLQAIPKVTVVRHGNEDSSVFTVTIPANDRETEYAVYYVKRDIYQTFSDARFEVIVEDVPAHIHSDDANSLTFDKR